MSAEHKWFCLDGTQLTALFIQQHKQGGIHSDTAEKFILQRVPERTNLQQDWN